MYIFTIFEPMYYITDKMAAPTDSAGKVRKKIPKVKKTNIGTIVSAFLCEKAAFLQGWAPHSFAFRTLRSFAF